MPQQLPPAMTGQPSFGAAPVGQPTGNPGHMAQAAAAVREAIAILASSVSKFPPGSEPQQKLAKAIELLTHTFPESESSVGVQKTEALDMAQRAQQQNQMASLMRALGGDGGGMGGPQQQAA